MLPGSAFNWMRSLRDNNNREWFTANKHIYLQEVAQVEAFADALLQELQGHDIIETPSGKKSLYRIYRDIRFTKDKTPFSTYWGGRFKRSGRQRRGGYYYHFEEGDKSFVLCGFWGPSAEDLKRIREDIAFDAAPLRAILGSEVFRGQFGTLQGEQLKTSPKGYDSGHEALDLLRYKQFLVMRRFTDAEVLNANFLQEASLAFREMRPFLDYMSEVLSADRNGTGF